MFSCKSRSNRNVCSTKNRSQCPRMCNLCKSRNNNNGNSNGVTTPYSVWFNSLDERADPCQDFYQFTCGKYLRNNKPKTANEVNSPLTDIAKNVAKQKLGNLFVVSLKIHCLIPIIINFSSHLGQQ